MEIYATLEIINSRADIYGNRYWAFRYTDHDSGNSVEGTISGGESNINAIRLHMGRVDGWDAGINTRRTELKIREFNRLTKDWPHAGCNPEDLANFIKERLAKIPS